MNANRARRPRGVKDCRMGGPSSSFLSGAPYMKTPSESQIATAQIWARMTAGQGRRSESRSASESGEGNDATNAIARMTIANAALRPLRAT
jgi:hypothetical protein